jgi:hypothetical protein
LASDGHRHCGGTITAERRLVSVFAIQAAVQKPSHASGDSLDRSSYVTCQVITVDGSLGPYPRRLAM